jgi:Nuclease-related domain
LTENERKVPIRLKQAEALRNRLLTQHKKSPEIESEIARRRAGFRGEQNLDYHLSFLPDSKNYTIFKDLNLKDRHTFQIDTLLISSYYALIIEVKNYSGILHIDPHTKQLIRKKGQNTDGFPNLILQAIRHQKQLKNWLQKEKFESYPVEYLVAFHEGNSIFKSDQMDKRLFNRLIFADNIHNKLNQFETIHQIPEFDQNRIRKLKKRL